MSSFAAAVLFGSAFPRVENPLPESIGLGFPFALAGAGGVLAGVFRAGSSQASRDRAIIQGGLFGFWAGVVVYLLSLLVQIGSKL